jgi:glycerophosphoryl diester phosphodiesterase
MPSPLICFGHRGAMGHEPENTLRSIRRGIELGADWIEVDVQLVEGRLVVFHDERLERTTNGAGLLRETSLAELRRLDAGKGERIPTLDEVFDAIGARAGLNIELKGPATADAVVRTIHTRLEQGWSRDRLLVSSFDHAQLRRVRELDAEIRLGALIEKPPAGGAAFAEALGCVSVHIAKDHVDAPFVADAHRRGLAVYVYTVNESHDLARMQTLGVDGVFSDFPERVAAS